MNKLNPENLFIPSHKSVEDILSCYNLPLTRFEPATSGIENLTLLVWSEKKRYVLRVYPQQKKSDAEVLLELDFMSHLRKNGLPLPEIISSLDNHPCVVCELDDKKWQCILMEHAQGAHPEEYTPEVLDHMATLQASMHILGEQYAKAHSIASSRIILQATPLTHELPNNTAHDSSLRDFLQRANSFAVDLHDSLPKGLSHFDLGMDNLFAIHHKVTAILDFGDVEYMPLVVCLGYTLWDVLFEPGGAPALVTRYLEKYQAVRQLSQSEKEVLLQTILFRHYMLVIYQMQLGDFSRHEIARALEQEQDLRELELIF